MTVSAMGAVRGAKLLLEVNQKAGFDCQSCAWPSPDGERHTFEFCENGAKAVAMTVLDTLNFVSTPHRPRPAPWWNAESVVLKSTGCATDCAPLPMRSAVVIVLA